MLLRKGLNLLFHGCSLLPYIFLLYGCGIAVHVTESDSTSPNDLFYESLADWSDSTMPADERLDWLLAVYSRAQQNDLNAIALLRKTEAPERWPKIWQHYQNMAERDSALQALPDTIAATVWGNFSASHPGHQADARHARYRAAGYFYAAAAYFMHRSEQSEDGMDAAALRSAYRYFSALNLCIPGFKDADSLQGYCLRHMNPVVDIEFVATEAFLAADFDWQLSLTDLPDFDLLFSESDTVSFVAFRNFTDNTEEEADFQLRIFIDEVSAHSLSAWIELDNIATGEILFADTFSWQEDTSSDSEPAAVLAAQAFHTALQKSMQECFSLRVPQK